MIESYASARQREEGVQSFNVVGTPVSAMSLDRAAETIERWATDDIGRIVCIRDVHGVMQAHQDPQLQDIHYQASMITPDGMPLVWLGKHQGVEISRTCGPDLMEHVMARSSRNGLRHYFYGGKDGVAQRLRDVFVTRFPGVQILRTGSPPFRPLTDAELAEVAADIKASEADVVWVGISTPKQELLMERLYRLVPATLIGVGAAFDFHTGAVKRAPRWMQRSGMEWSYRLSQEPARLWRRYLIMAPKFVAAVVKQALTR